MRDHRVVAIVCECGISSEGGELPEMVQIGFDVRARASSKSEAGSLFPGALPAQTGHNACPVIVACPSVHLCSQTLTIFATHSTSSLPFGPHRGRMEMEVL